MGQAPPRRSLPLRALLTILVVLAATACGGSPKAAPTRAPSIAATPTDPEVSATGLPDGLELELTDTAPGIENGDNLNYVSPVFTVVPLGPLATAATVTVRLDNAVPDATPLVVATRASASEPWSYQPGQLTSDQRHVEFTTTSLSEVGVLAVDRLGALAGFRDDVRASLYPAVGTPAQKPTCEEAELAKTFGYSVSVNTDRTLHWCLGLIDGSPIVRITNRRATPVQIDHTGFEVMTEPSKRAAYALWAPVVGDTSTLLAPGSTASYSTKLDSESEVQLEAASTEETQGLRVLQAGSLALAAGLKDFGAGPARGGSTFKSLLGRKRCARSLSKGVATVVTRCFTTAALADIFGSRALLLAPLVAAPSFRAFFDKQAKVLATQATDQRERIVLRRAQPDFSGLVGVWSGHTRQLSINDAGLVTEKIEDGCCSLVIQLTYQLENPITKDGVINADAKITAVKVGNRKQVSGQVPKVGDTGTISLRAGVIHPPFLKTTYCDRKAAKKGTCGA